MKIHLSFIVPCLNSQATIVACLQSILAQNLSPETFEVLVVDNGSTDRTLSLVESFPVIVLHESRKGAAAARNAGIAAAQGEYAAFVDSDVCLHPDWARTLLVEMGNFFDAAQGQIRPSANAGSARWLDRYRTQVAGQITSQTFLNMKWFELILPLVNTAACIYRTSIVKNVGGFNTELLRCEDNDLAEKILVQGGAILGCEKALAWVYYDGGWIRYLKRSFWIGFWKERLNQAWQRPRLPVQWKVQPISGAFSFRMFWRLNSEMKKLGAFAARFLVGKLNPSSAWGVRIALQSQKPRKLQVPHGSIRHLRKEVGLMAVQNKLFLMNRHQSGAVFLFQDQYKEAFLSLFDGPRDERMPIVRQQEVLQVLSAKGLGD